MGQRLNPTAIIVDDEVHLTDYLEEKLKRLWPELEILGTAVNGLQVANQLRSCQIVFVTAFDQYAVAAFDHAAVDYLLKPVTEERLALTVEKLRHGPATPNIDIQGLLNQLKQTPQHYLQWIRTGTEGVTELVAIDDVVYFQADQKYTSVYTENQEHFIRTSSKELEAELDPNKFWRIHRGIIVSVPAIKSARRDLRGRYTLTLNKRAETVRSSQTYSHHFKQM